MRDRWQLTLLLWLCAGFGSADFADECPETCTCKWANGKREADCRNGGFNEIPSNLHQEIQILRFGENIVRKLKKEVFKSSGLLNLQRIYLDNCHLQEIHQDAFRDLRIMVELDLSRNNLSWLSPKTFEGNSRLQTLTLSHNRIVSLKPFQFPPLRHLKTVDLSHNVITYIDKKTFYNLGNSLESVFINNNRLKSLRDEVFLPLTNLKSMQLHGNNWVCDCKLKDFRDWILRQGLFTYPLSCAEPERLAEKLWENVETKDFACKPEISVPKSVVFSQPGANVTLSCFIIGSPKPEAKWVLKGRIVNNNTTPSGSGIPGKESRFLIYEDGGLERWFNLTITNVGVSSVADYTCVAVNAGGVMEENISLTFEEPEPVGLPGGKKEETETSNFGIIVGAVSGGLFFVFVIMVSCCCCCRRQRRGRKTGNRTPPLPPPPIGQNETSGSVVGFVETGRKCSKTYEDVVDKQRMEMLRFNSPGMRKNVVVSNLGSSNVTTNSIVDSEQFPDLLSMTRTNRQIRQLGNNNNNNNSGDSSPNRTHQPLNPAALVHVPVTAPAQFPHQFPHLIHHSSSATLPHQRHHHRHLSPRSSYEETSLPPLLSPPAQFAPPEEEEIPSGFVTLPRRSLQRGPIYDGVGPRTSASGALSTDEPIVRRHSGSSEATEEIASYCEPFGAASFIPPGGEGKRDSIVSSEDAEFLEATASENVNLKEPKQLKGILKGGTMSNKVCKYGPPIETMPSIPEIHPAGVEVSRHSRSNINETLNV